MFDRFSCVPGPTGLLKQHLKNLKYKQASDSLASVSNGNLLPIGVCRAGFHQQMTDRNITVNSFQSCPQFECVSNVWVLPKIGVLQNGWFTMENPWKPYEQMDDLGGFPYFWFNTRVMMYQTSETAVVDIGKVSTLHAFWVTGALPWKANGLKATSSPIRGLHFTGSKLSASCTFKPLRRFLHLIHKNLLKAKQDEAEKSLWSRSQRHKIMRLYILYRVDPYTTVWRFLQHHPFSKKHEGSTIFKYLLSVEKTMILIEDPNDIGISWDSAWFSSFCEGKHGERCLQQTCLQQARLNDVGKMKQQ